MTPQSDKPPPLTTVQDQALHWFARMEGGRADPARLKAFQVWLEEDPAHAEAYREVVQLWHSPAFEAALRPYAAEPRARRGRPRMWAAAAALLLALVWGLTGFGWLDRWHADYTTTTGEQKQIALADGSTVLLNTDSALALDFSADARGVRLLSGEAFFEIAHDSFRPFLVRTGEAQVRVIGTRFSVQVEKETEVRVESGIVACSNGRGEGVQVSRDQEVNVSSRRVSQPRYIDAGQAFAWTRGRLVFKDLPLEAVLEQLDRYHPGAILVLNRTLAKTPVTGNYKLQDTSAAIRALAEALGARVTEIPGVVTALR